MKLKNEQFVLGVGRIAEGNLKAKLGEKPEDPLNRRRPLSSSRVPFSAVASNRDKYAHQAIISLPSPVSDGARAGRRWADGGVFNPSPQKGLTGWAEEPPQKKNSSHG